MSDEAKLTNASDSKPDKPPVEIRNISTIGLLGRTTWIAFLALLTALLLTWMLKSGWGHVANLVDFLAALLPSKWKVVEHMSDAASVLRRTTVALGQAGIAVAALLATMKECLSAVEGVYISRPTIELPALRSASWKLATTLTLFFVSVLSVREAAATQSGSLALSFPRFILPLEVESKSLLTVFVPFEEEAGNVMLATVDDPSVTVAKMYRPFLASLGAGLVSCRDPKKLDGGIKLSVVGFATGSRYSDGKEKVDLAKLATGDFGDLEKALIGKNPSNDWRSEAGKKMIDVAKFAADSRNEAKSGIDVLDAKDEAKLELAAFDDGFDLLAANKRRDSVVACLVRTDSFCSDAVSSLKDGAFALRRDEVKSVEWKDYADMRESTIDDRKAHGLEEKKKVRGFLTRYARIDVFEAGVCTRSTMADLHFTLK